MRKSDPRQAQLMFYPNRPGWKQDDTSRLAGQKMRTRSRGLRDIALEALRNHGPMTADEIAAKVDQSILSIRPRIAELNRLGYIKDTGKRRTNESGANAIVWECGWVQGQR